MRQLRRRRQEGQPIVGRMREFGEGISSRTSKELVCSLLGSKSNGDSVGSRREMSDSILRGE